MRGKKSKYTYMEIKEIILELGYILISKEYVNTLLPLVIADNEGYYFSIPFNNIRKKGGFYKFHKSNPFTIQNIQLWLKLNNKEFELVSEKYIDSNSKLKLKCLKENCGEYFELSCSEILLGIQCKYCTGFKVGLSNCLATKNPELTKEWHLTKNGNLTPYDVTCGYYKYIWWQCSKNPKHEWEATVTNRHSNTAGCPYCAGKLPSEDHNLLIDNPYLCEEWNYNKNSKLPDEYTPHASLCVWWQCKECGWEWYTSIASRNSGNKSSGCPQCKESKGEKRIKECLNNHNIFYTWQKIFNGLLGLGNGNLLYDFYLPDYNLLIEYDGEYHYKPIKYYKNEPIKYAEERLNKQKTHDRLKDKYAEDYGINLLRIPYWEFDNIEKILNTSLINYKQYVSL